MVQAWKLWCFQANLSILWESFKTGQRNKVRFSTTLGADLYIPPVSRKRALDTFENERRQSKLRVGGKSYLNCYCRQSSRKLLLSFRNFFLSTKEITLFALVIMWTRGENVLICSHYWRCQFTFNYVGIYVSFEQINWA